MGCHSRSITLTLAVACAALSTNHTHAAESTSNADACNDNTGLYSVLRVPSRECADPPNVEQKRQSASDTIPKDDSHRIGPTRGRDEPLDVEWLEGEMLAFTVIGLAQIRGGTSLLADLWYAAAVLTPPLLKRHPDYGVQLNYYAITPPFVALGLLNGYLHNDHADNARVFLSNFIGFNLGLAWAQHVWKSPDHFFAAAEPANVPKLDANLFALRDGAGIFVAYRW